MKMNKNVLIKAAFIGVSIFATGTYFKHHNQVKPAQGVVLSDYKPGKIRWFTCKDGSWCRISDLAARMGRNGDQSLTYYWNVKGTYIAWTIIDGRNYVFHGMYKDNIGQTLGDLAGKYKANAETTYVSFTQDPADKYDTPWGGTGEYASINMPDR